MPLDSQEQRYQKVAKNGLKTLSGNAHSLRTGDEFQRKCELSEGLHQNGRQSKDSVVEDERRGYWMQYRCWMKQRYRSAIFLTGITNLKYTYIVGFKILDNFLIFFNNRLFLEMSRCKRKINYQVSTQSFHLIHSKNLLRLYIALHFIIF